MAKNLGINPNIDIDLTHVQLASVIGPNGIGKTLTFTLIPTYCFYGVTKRGRTENGITIDHLLKSGEHELLLLVEFEEAGNIYQIIRTYTEKSRGKGKSTLDFQIKEGDKWESLNGTKNSETQEKIIKILGIDVDAFISSSMILQNSADELTKRPSNKRKAIYTQFLGLDIYDRLQLLAKEKEKAVSVKLEASKQTLERLSAELETLPATEADLQLAKNNIAYVTLDIRTKETELADIQAAIKSLEAKQQEVKQIEKQIILLDQDIADRRLEIDRYDLNIRTAQKILESEPLITAKVAELEQIKSQIPALEAKETRLRELQTEEKRLSKEETILADEQADLAKRITALVVDLRKKDELKLASEQYQHSLAELKGLDEKAEQYQALMTKRSTAETELLKASTDLDTLLNEYSQLEKKVAILQNSGCIDPQNARCKFLIDAQQAREKMPELKEKIEAGRLKINPLYDSRESLKAEMEALNYDSGYHGHIKRQSEMLRKQTELYASLSGKEELLQTVQQQSKQLSERIGTINDQMLVMQINIKALQTETENLPILKAKIPSLELYVKQKDKLPEAKAVIQNARESIAKLDAEIAAKNEQRKTLQDTYLALHNEVVMDLPYRKDMTEDIQNALKVLQADLNKLHSEQGSYLTKLGELNKAQTEYDKLKAELAPTAKELVRWETLTRAFGKSGIQALIIDSNIKEQEHITNEILHQMTNGENSIKFDTQRDKKDGSGQIETLDIWVSTSSGYERIYETYSGGQKLRIDLALSLGLAALSASKTGSKIEFCILDEIWGSQDSEHRDLLVESLKAISSRFKQILVISHIPEVQAAFDQQIVMSEGGRVDIQFS